MKLFQLLPKKLYDFACNLPTGQIREVLHEDIMESRNASSFRGASSPVYDEVWKFSARTIETQGMGTVERPAGPNGEVPRPLRSFRVFVENSPPHPHARVFAPAGWGSLLSAYEGANTLFRGKTDPFAKNACQSIECGVIVPSVNGLLWAVCLKVRQR